MRSRRARATYDGHAREVVRTDNGRESKRQQINGTKTMSFDPGDEKAKVSATRGFKTWFSTREAGLTVESTVTVTVSCGQDHESIEVAADECGQAAEQLAKKGAEDMGLYLDEFNKDMK